MSRCDYLKSSGPLRIYYLSVVNLALVRPVFAAGTPPLALPHPASSSSIADTSPDDAASRAEPGASGRAEPTSEGRRAPNSDYSTQTADILSVEAHNSTYIPLFRRALLPGAAGSIVAPQTALPVYDYLMIRVLDADMPWAKNSLDMELSLWGSGAFIGTTEPNRVFDGDVTVANATQRFGLNYVKLGRQYVTEGAARFAHLDGASWGVRSRSGFELSGYGGLTVLPRWDQRPNYQHIGTVGDTLISSTDQLPHSQRSGNWMMGARVGYSANRLGELGLSIHEQQENSALGRRDAALDVHFFPSKVIDASGRALMDLDSRGIADAFVGLSLHPERDWDIATEYRRMIPTLLMSRQSVLSVFAVDRFDEAGGEARYHVSPRALLFGGGFVQWLQGDGVGLRARAGTKLYPDRAHRLMVQLAYTRVEEPQNGYHGTRLSTVYRVSVPVTLTAEQYTYFYDRAIRGMSTSNVHVATVSWRFLKSWEAMLAGSVFHSPYAATDAQTLLRIAYTFGVPQGGEP